MTAKQSRTKNMKSPAKSTLPMFPPINTRQKRGAAAKKTRGEQKTIPNNSPVINCCEVNPTLNPRPHSYDRTLVRLERGFMRKFLDFHKQCFREKLDEVLPLLCESLIPDDFWFKWLRPIGYRDYRQEQIRANLIRLGLGLPGQDNFDLTEDNLSKHISSRSYDPSIVSQKVIDLITDRLKGKIPEYVFTDMKNLFHNLIQQWTIIENTHIHFDNIHFLRANLATDETCIVITVEEYNEQFRKFLNKKVWSAKEFSTDIVHICLRYYPYIIHKS